MWKAILICLAALVGGAPSGAQERSGPSSWKGKYVEYQFNLAGAVAVGGDTNGSVVHSGSDWRSDYDLYQNDRGVVRLELTRMNRYRSVEGPLENKILDYSRGVGWIWDKGGTTAIEGPFGPPVAGKSLGRRQILGFTCGGEEYEWKTGQQSRVQLQSWSPQDTSFRFPVLRVQYVTDSAGVLLALIVDVVTQVEAVPDLPSSLFNPPAGLKVHSVPSLD